MKLKTIPRLEVLKPLKKSKALSMYKEVVINIPSESTLILLAIQLHTKTMQILNKEIKCKKGLRVEDYIYKAISIIKILDNYPSTIISYQELKCIKKEFSIS